VLQQQSRQRDIITCFIKGESRGTSAGEAPVSVDASASSANVGVQIALVDVRAGFAVDFGVAFGTVALVAVASYARGTPRDSYRTTTLRASAQLRQVVLAASVVEFGPTRTFAIVWKVSYSRENRFRLRSNLCRFFRCCPESIQGRTRICKSRKC
jgi:hypothetical protein